MKSASRRKFVCAQCSGRDWYELPIALEKAGLLAEFCTDFYAKEALRRWIRSDKVRARRARNGALPDDKVRISWSTVFWQRISAAMIRDTELKAYWPDSFLTRMLKRRAERCDAHLLTYEPWAVKRPAGGFANGRRQVVFHCHPHVDTEDRIYAADRSAFAQFYDDSHVTKSRWRRRTADAWRQADLVICASSFTKKSLLAAGMEEERIVVVPYGVGGRHTADGTRQGAGEGHSAYSMRHTANGQRQGPLKLLFVGRNPLRKGLHHLLLAWSRAERKPMDRLVVVCREKPRALVALANAAGGVEWRDYVSNEELSNLYKGSDALAVPSLCEGFGHVYLEAMAHGCPVIGTDHSVLPDIGGEESGVFRIEAGNVGQLAGLIGSCSANKEILESKRTAAGAQPAGFQWENFRQQVVEAVEALC